MSRIFVLGCLTTLALTVLPGRTDAAAFQNGSFESVSNSFAGYPNQFASATGWTVNPNGGYSGGDGIANVAFSGSQGTTDAVEAAVFNPDGSDPVGSLYQSFSTTPGQKYSVSFDFGQYGGRNSVSSSLQVTLVAGAALNSQSLINPGATDSANAAKAGLLSMTDQNGVVTISDSGGSGTAVFAAAPNPEFSSFTFTFNATNTTSTIDFTDVSNTTLPANDGQLDNVRISAVPEPASIGLLASATALIVTRRKRNA